MKDYLKKLIQKRKDELTKLRKALVDSNNQEERTSLNDSITVVEEEIREAENQLANLDLPAQAQNPMHMRSVGSNTTDDSEDVYSSIAYRKAFMKAILTGKKVDFRADETTKTTDTNINTVIPTNLANYIMEKWEQLGVIYNLVTKTNYPVGVTIPTDGVKPVATWVGEGASSDSQKKTLGGTITFTHFKLRCEIRYTEEVNTMTLAMFEQLFVKQVSDAMLRAVEGAIVDGNGTSAPQGIATIWSGVPAERKIELASTDKLSYKLLCDAEAAIPVEYEGTAKWCMTKKTFMSFMAMTDTVGQPIARVNYGIGGRVERTLLGREVVLYVPQTGSQLHSWNDAAPTADELFAFIVDFGDYVLNTNYNLGIQNAIDWDNEDHKTKAVLACDGKLIKTDSLVVLAKKKA